MHWLALSLIEPLIGFGFGDFNACHGLSDECKYTKYFLALHQQDLGKSTPTILAKGCGLVACQGEKANRYEG